MRAWPPAVATDPAAQATRGYPGLLLEESHGGSMQLSAIEQTPLGRAPRAAASAEQGKAAMQDFTLVIPTYNRPKQLEALLTHLGAQRPECRILILDSSDPNSRAAN